MPLVTGPSSAIQPVQLPDMVGDYAKLAMLKNQLQEAPLRQQALQQQVDAGAIENQRGQQNINSQKALMRAYSEAGGDLSKTVPLAAKYGASPDALVKLQQSAIEQQSANIKLLQEKGSRALQEADLYQGAHDAVAQAPAAQRPAAYQQQVQGLQQAGIDVSQLPPQYPGDEAFKTFGIALKGHKQQLEELSKQADIGKTVAQTGEANAKANEANVNASLAPQKVANQVANDATMRKQGAQRISIEQARLNFDQTRQGTQDQQAIESQAQQIANGEVKGLSQARNNPFTRAVMARVYEINPNYSDSLYSATQDLRSSKPNSMGGNVGRLGTAILHADEALNHSKDLGFSEGLLTGVGTSGTAAYKQAAEFLTGEIGQYVTGGKLTVDEGKKLSSDLMSSRQGVRDAALNEIITLSKGKLQSQMGQYKNATRNDFPTDRVFNDPDIKSALEKHGVIGSANSGGARPAGATHIVPGPDGKNHYTNATGTVDLGVAP
jgi:polyhydroxyalkanoate synthesis regulator phasin